MSHLFNTIEAVAIFLIVLSYIPKHGNKEQYQQALDGVIFEGFKNYDTDIVMSPLVFLHLSEYKTIEDAINAGVKLKHKGF